MGDSQGEQNLWVLLRTMTPVLQDHCYGFYSLSAERLAALEVTPLGLFQEPEGVTVIISESQVMQAQLPIVPTWRLITLSVHSDLQAVGFLAAVTTALAQEEISVNAISAYFHDHLFVPADQAEAALACLHNLSASVV
ncbi:MAG: ACT domain-containing protein [Leptolyngbyaceae cyanobacterium SM2_3_12]|nr:ACT domain-containing protein [Leptolyngbyaceae cyanobacterium SM2_3_12]